MVVDYDCGDSEVKVVDAYFARTIDHLSIIPALRQPGHFFCDGISNHFKILWNGSEAFTRSLLLLQVQSIASETDLNTRRH